MDKRLTKQKWVEHGLKTLASKGAVALKAEPMAKALNVSRGSFYWHFTDINMFQKDVLELWRQRTTLQVIEDIEGASNKSDRLNTLMQKAFNIGRGLEREVRAWAIRNPNAAKIVAAVDNERIKYISELLISGDISKPQVRRKATFLYWAYLGQTMMVKDNADQFGAEDIEEIIALFNR